MKKLKPKKRRCSEETHISSGAEPGVKSDVYDYRVWFWGECGLEHSFAAAGSEKDRFLLFPCRSLLGSPLYVVLADCNV